MKEVNFSHLGSAQKVEIDSETTHIVGGSGT